MDRSLPVTDYESPKVLRQILKCRSRPPLGVTLGFVSGRGMYQGYVGVLRE